MPPTAPRDLYLFLYSSCTTLAVLRLCYLNHTIDCLHTARQLCSSLCNSTGHGDCRRLNNQQPDERVRHRNETLAIVSETAPGLICGCSPVISPRLVLQDNSLLPGSNGSIAAPLVTACLGRTAVWACFAIALLMPVLLSRRRLELRGRRCCAQTSNRFVRPLLLCIDWCLCSPQHGLSGSAPPAPASCSLARCLRPYMSCQVTPRCSF